MDALEVLAVTKKFGTTRALDDCSLTMDEGAVHAVLGENGSGKSTLVKILAGVHSPDRGEVRVAQTTVRRFTPRSLRDHGVAAVFQEILTAPQRSVLDNIFLGHDSMFGMRAPESERRALAHDALARLTDQRIDLDDVIAHLPLPQQQLVTIVRALIRHPRILILDEAAATLSLPERSRLFEVIAERRSAGCTVIYITHRIGEVDEIADVVHVLRNGRYVARHQRGDVGVDDLVRLMSPHLPAETSPVRPVLSGPHRSHRAGPAVLRARDVVVAEGATPVDFELRRGEIVGLAGLDGHGHEQFLQMLGGLRQPVSGQVLAVSHDERGGDRRLTSPRLANDAGVVYLPRDRRTEGILPTLSILDNFGIVAMRSLSWWGIIRRRPLRRLFMQITSRLSVTLSSPHASIESLSGGNQQKVLLARWLTRRPAVMLLNEPTRGIDTASRHALHQALREIAAAGTAMVLLSTDVEELLLVADRVVVFHRGSVSASLTPSNASATVVVAAMFGEGAR